MFVVMTDTNEPGSLSFFGIYNSKKEAMNVIRSLENNGFFASLLFMGDAKYSSNRD